VQIDGKALKPLDRTAVVKRIDEWLAVAP